MTLESKNASATTMQTTQHPEHSHIFSTVISGELIYINCDLVPKSGDQVLVLEINGASLVEDYDGQPLARIYGVVVAKPS
ncbi:hypothetical protein [Alkanindiges illinoisensis]|uniref:hypothetical protein n=1 Tax=Alkanindiges illinoisensis TaxID=197183 RepID=UPI000479D622|nr:hypothetical protein [Alkanindiges illinoisensis]